MSKEFVEKDSKVGYIITIVLLILVILGLSGFIGYGYFFKSQDKCNAPVEVVEEKDEVYELTYSEAEKYMNKIAVYNNHFSSYFISKTEKEISNDDLLTFAFRMIDHEGIVTKEKVEDVLHKYFGKNVKFKHDDIKCYAGEEVYEYSKEKYLRDYINLGFKKENIYFFDDENPEEFRNLNIDLIYVCGGNTFLLQKCLRESDFEKDIIEYVRQRCNIFGFQCGNTCCYCYY